MFQESCIFCKRFFTLRTLKISEKKIKEFCLEFNNKYLNIKSDCFINIDFNIVWMQCIVKIFKTNLFIQFFYNFFLNGFYLLYYFLFFNNFFFFNSIDNNWNYSWNRSWNRFFLFFIFCFKEKSNKITFVLLFYNEKVFV